MHRNILFNMLPVHMGKTITLVENSPARIRGKFSLWNVPGWVNGFIDDLWVTAKIRGLPEVKLPIIEDGETSTERLQKTLLYEWGTARLELEFLLGDEQGRWASFGETAIKNSNGYRYRKHRAIDIITDNPGYRLQENWKIGARLVNVGFGDLTNKDVIDFTGSWNQEFIAIQAQPAYVINNVYGGTGSASPTPTPTPTPDPTFALSLPEGKTSVVANNNEQIILSIANLPLGTELTGTWFKGSASTGISESITMVSGGLVILYSNKLVPQGASNYKLKFTYQSKEYFTNEVAVTLAPQVNLTITSTTSGNLDFFVVAGAGYEFAITGSNFTPGTATYTWFRGTNPATKTNSAGATPVNITGTVTVDANGNFTLNKSTSQATFESAYDTSDKSGLYKLRITQESLTVDSNTIYGQNSVPSIGFSPTSASATTNSTINASVSGFSVGDLLTISWVKNNVELESTRTQHTYSQNTGNSFSGFYYGFNTPSTNFAVAPYNGAGTYKLRVAKNNTPAVFVSTNTLTINA